MKPTDIWTNHPDPQFKPPCKKGDNCHEAAPRGSHNTGTQALANSVERSKNKTKATVKLFDEIRRNRKFYQNRHVEEPRQLV